MCFCRIDIALQKLSDIRVVTLFQMFLNKEVENKVVKFERCYNQICSRGSKILKYGRKVRREGGSSSFAVDGRNKNYTT